MCTFRDLNLTEGTQFIYKVISYLIVLISHNLISIYNLIVRIIWYFLWWNLRWIFHKMVTDLPSWLSCFLICNINHLIWRRIKLLFFVFSHGDLFIIQQMRFNRWTNCSDWHRLGWIHCYRKHSCLKFGWFTDQSNLKFCDQSFISQIPATRYAILEIHQEKSLCKFSSQPGLGLATDLKELCKSTLFFHGLLTMKGIWPLGLIKKRDSMITIGIIWEKGLRRSAGKPLAWWGHRRKLRKIRRPAVKILARSGDRREQKLLWTPSSKAILNY